MNSFAPNSGPPQCTFLNDEERSARPPTGPSVDVKLA
jgi:hypothetical protein